MEENKNNETLTRKEWLGYINKLQERERAKILSSGLTFWILTSSIFAITYKLCIDFSKVQQNFKEIIIFSTSLYNSYTYIFDLLNLTIRKHKMSQYNNLTNKKSIGFEQKKIWNVFENIFMIIYLIGNLWACMIYLKTQDFGFAFISYGILVILSGFKVINEIESKYMNISNKKENFQIGENIIVLMILTLQFAFIYRNIEINKYVFIYAVSIVLIIAECINIVQYMLKKMRISWLEDFEELILIT